MHVIIHSLCKYIHHAFPPFSYEPAVPSSAPENVTAIAMDSRTLVVSWRPPPTASQNGILTEYVVNISVADSGEQLQYRTTTGSASSLLISSLHPDYTHTYIVAAATAVGTGPFSTPRSVRMPEDGESTTKLVHVCT